MFLLKYDISKQNTRKRVEIHPMKNKKREAAEPIGFLVGGRPFRPKQKADHKGLKIMLKIWSGITLRCFALVRSNTYNFAKANLGLCAVLVRRSSAKWAPKQKADHKGLQKQILNGAVLR